MQSEEMWFLDGIWSNNVRDLSQWWWYCAPSSAPYDKVQWPSFRLIWCCLQYKVILVYHRDMNTRWP